MSVVSLFCCLMLTWLPGGVAETVPIAASAVAPLFALKSALGLSFTDWAADRQCLYSGFDESAGWSGVSCYGNNGNPAVLSLNNLKLSGSLPKGIASLTALRHIRLARNHFNHELARFTSDIVKIASLVYVSLSNNFFYGSIPAALLQMPALDGLMLGSNYLTGSVPPITAPLYTFMVSSNYLTGTFPKPVPACVSHGNCFSDHSSCQPLAVMRDDAACAVCGKPKGTASSCGSGGTSVCRATAEEASVSGSSLPMKCQAISSSNAGGGGEDRKTCTKKKRAFCLPFSCRKGWICIPLDRKSVV